MFTKSRSGHSSQTLRIKGTRRRERFRMLMQETLEPRLLLAVNGSELRTYRFAVAATEEYTAFHGSRAQAQAEIVSLVDSMNVVLNSELNVHLDLLDRFDLIYGPGNSPDPFSGAGGDPSPALDENQSLLDSVLGVSGYDLGHVFGTFSGGRATLGGAGVDASKGKAASGISSASGPDTERLLDIVLHEVGHHLNANHSFNGVLGFCVERNASTAYEPGSGTTIMSYAGICPATFAEPPVGDNIQNGPADTYFHAGSLAEIVPHLESLDTAGVGVRTTGTTPPIVDAGLNYSIPAGTPFEITVTGSDADGDSLLYTIEQMDTGPAQTVDPFPGDNGMSPLFRSFPPAPAQNGGFTRTFPQISDILTGTTTKGEYLPSVARNLNFRATARDSMGGINMDDMLVTVVDTGVPFQVTSPNTAATLMGGSTQNVMWDVAGTSGGTIATSMADIRLSIDAGMTYPFSLAVTENDGMHSLPLPNIDAAAARVKIAGVGNIFFDVSDVDFTLAADPTAIGVSVSDDVVVGEAGLYAPATDTYNLSLNTAPGGTVELSVTADDQSEVSVDGVTFASSVTFTRSDTTSQTITVRAKDDSVGEGPHTSTIKHAIVSGTTDYPVGTLINDVVVDVVDNERPPVIGVDLQPDLDPPPDPPFTVPANWTPLTDPFGTGMLMDLIREDGSPTDVDLSITVTNVGSRGGATVTPMPDTVPIHTPSLSGLDGNLRWRNGSSEVDLPASVNATWTNLMPGQRYGVYVFAMESISSESINQLVTITGAGIDDPAPFMQVSAGKDDILIVNDADGDATRTLESYAKIVTAGTGLLGPPGVINVNVMRDDDVARNRIHLAGFAIQEILDAPPVFTKSFAPDPIDVGGTSTLSFTIDNIANAVSDATDLDFTDTLPAGLVIATPANGATTCTGGALTATAGGSVITYSGGTVAAAASCTVQVDVTSDLAANYTNISGNLTSSLGNSGPASDTLTVNALPTFDFGDAPNSYLTLDGSVGPKHTIGSTLFLGAAMPDADSDGFGDGTENNPNTATDDDTEGSTPNDEDAVSGFSLLSTSSTSYSVSLGLGNTTGGSANLVGWIDFDRNGTFESDEAATATVANNATTATLTWNNIGSAGPDIAVGASFARFRLTSDTIDGSNPGGSASDGEVEDYALTITAVPGFVKSFAPNPILVGGTSTLTFTIDNAVNTVGASDLAFIDTLPAQVVIATPSGAATTCGGTLTADAGSSNITLDGGTVSAASTCTVSVDVTTSTANTYSNTSGDLTSSLGNSGPASDTLIVDEVVMFDFGDAPTAVQSGFANDYPTLLSNGARHVIVAGAPFLGAVTPDAEADGMPDPVALGDDSTDTDDEDAIIFAGLTLVAGKTIPAATLSYDGGAAGGFIDGWIDYNRNGIWESPSEQILDDFAIAAGPGSTDLSAIPINVPAGISPGNTYARFRVASTAVAGPDGSAADGEVEDHLVTTCGFVVTTTSDVVDATDQVNSLREAILCANNSPGLDTITFDILPAGGVKTIQPSSALPIITDPVMIDGYTQSGASANTNPVGQGLNTSITVEIDGSSAGSSGLVLQSGSNGSTIRGLAINRFSGVGIFIDGSGGHTIEGNFIGTTADGTTAAGNSGDGIAIVDSASNTIGGTNPAARNLVSANNRGIGVFSSPSTGNVIQGNLVGTDAAGTADLGNVLFGIHVFGASTTTIGGTATGAGNLVSGNDSRGVNLSRDSSGAIVQGNFIGTQVDGTGDLGNALDGVRILDSTNNTIGGSAATAANVIGGNDANGVLIEESTSFANTVLGNFIGTNAAGTNLGNTGNGIAINEASGNTIGGNDAGAGNTIGFNSMNGVFITQSDAFGNTVAGNFIGTDASGTQQLGNIEHGVSLLGSGMNTIGSGTGIDNAANIIAFNGGHGVRNEFVAVASDFKSILGNSIFDNAGLGINLVGGIEDIFGVTANDPQDTDTGSNNLQNYPVLVSAITNATTVVTGTLNSTPDRSFRIEFFSNPTADPSGHGEGKTFLGFQEVTTHNVTGDAAIDFDTGVIVPSGSFISATATDLNTSDTSEFSQVVEVVGACSLIVDTTADLINSTDSVNSLREAIICANTTPGLDTIALPTGTYTLTIQGANEDVAATGDLDVTDDLIITGAGAASTIIDAAGLSPGGDSVFGDRVMHVVGAGSSGGSPLEFTMADVTIRGGHLGLGDGGGLLNESGLVMLSGVNVVDNQTAESGGGVANAGGEMTISESTISGSIASGDGGGVANDAGDLTISASTVSGNDSSAEGGGIFTYGGTLTLSNSTISGNTASTSGGGIAQFYSGLMEIANSTITNNTATTGQGGGVDAGSVISRLDSTIIAGNTASSAPDLFHGITLFPATFNLIHDPAGHNVTNGVDDNIVGVDPLLGPLQDNGGPTETHLPWLASPAIDMGDNPDTLTTDQRGIGFPRTFAFSASNSGDGTDIGAVEVNDCSLVVTTTSDGLDSGTLRHAIGCANVKPGLDTINVPGGTYNLTLAGAGEDAALTGDLDITDDLLIVGAGAGSTFIDGNELDRVFDAFGVTFELRDVTVRNGNVTGANGGGIRSDQALALRDVIIRDNTASIAAATSVFSGGGGGVDATIFSAFDTQFVNNTTDGSGGGLRTSANIANFGRNTFTSNTAAAGGGAIFNGSTIALTDCTFDDNEATMFEGGGFAVEGGNLVVIGCDILNNHATQSEGGGFANEGGNLTIEDSVVDNNTSSAGGGGFVNAGGNMVMRRVDVTNNTSGQFGGGGFENQGGSLEVTDSTISGNTSDDIGGGFDNEGGSAVISGTTISGNTASSLGGGFIVDGGSTHIVNSTISGNVAFGLGGGIHVSSGSDFTSVNNTIVDNEVRPLVASALGGGLYLENSAAATLNNTIVANNFESGPTVNDISGAVVGMSNLVGDGTGMTGLVDGVDGNQVGSSGAAIDPLLGPLQNNGGLTQTHALLLGSPAIDAGNNTLAVDDQAASLTTDQRGTGFPRIDGAAVDVGAFESGLVALPTVGIADAAPVIEGNDLMFDVTLSRPLMTGEQVVVTYSTANDTAVAPGDYTAVINGTLTFDFGDPVTKVIAIATDDDDVPELDETLDVNMTATGVSNVDPASASGTIQDTPDFPVATIDSVTVTEGMDAVFTVTLNHPPVTTATINYSTIEGTAMDPEDYVGDADQLTFAPGVTTQTITITTKDDQDVDSDPMETFSVDLSGPMFAAIGNPGLGTGTILDNDMACSLVVTSTDDTVDSGDGFNSLREAILCANSLVGLNTITFEVPGAGPHTIEVGSTGLGPLPEITDPVIIDGYSESTDEVTPATENTDPLAFNGTLLIELDGTNAGPQSNGLDILAGGSTVRGLVINRFQGELVGDVFFGGNAIFLGDTGGNTIEGNILGMDPTGNTDLGNESAGILIGGEFESSPNNTVGGTTAAARNVIAGNRTGVEIDGAGSTGNVVAGNLIGTNAAGTSAVDLASAGIGIYEASGNTVGGTATGSRNVISGNGVGIFIAAEETPGIIHRYDAEGNAEDSIGMNDGVLLGGASFGTGVSGQGFEFDGVDDAVQIAQNTFDGLADFTVAGHVRFDVLDSPNDGQAIVSGLENGVSHHVTLVKWDDNALRLFLSGTQVVSPVFPFQTGQFYHIAATRAGGQVTLYVDGSPIHTQSTSSATIGINGGTTRIGGHDGVGNDVARPLDGAIDGLSIFNRALDAMEIADIASGTSVATANVVQGNYIGTDVSGANDVGNDIGVVISASGNTVGGTTTAARNVISGNQVSGVVLGTAGDANAVKVEDNVVQGNYVGTNATDTAALPNGGGDFNQIATRLNQIILDATGESPNFTAQDLADISGGVALAGATGNTVGGTVNGAGNVISGNEGPGVVILGGGDNEVHGNWIGTGTDGSSNFGNADAGILIEGSFGNTIAENTIAFNAFDQGCNTGVAILSGMGNALHRNSIFQNNGIGIDLLDDSVTPNDSGDIDAGPNDLLNFPVIESATISGGDLVLAGFARPGVEIEFFIADPDPTGFGEGRTYLVTRTEGSSDDDDASTGTYGPGLVNGLDQGTDTTNRFSFTIPLASLPSTVAAGSVLTSTATDAAGNTSEFSGNVTVEAEVILVDYGDAPDPGAGTGAGNYNTVAADNGPSHVIVPGLLMGTQVDADDGTLQNVTADADDTNPSAQTVVISDNAFDPGNWSATVRNTTGGATQIVQQEASGGNPGDYRRMQHTFPAPGSISVFHQFTGMTYDPSTQGAISSIDYSEDRIQFNPPFVGAAIGASPALMQNGNVFVGPNITYMDLQWTTETLTGLTAADFSGGGPDFSSNGGVIHFGYVRSNSTGTILETQHGIDNWSYTLNIAPPDDEDGLLDPAGDLDLTEGTVPQVEVSVTNSTNAPATLYGWIDYNGNGLFENATERASVIVPTGTSGGSVTLNFPAVPANSAASTYARFRLSTDGLAANAIGAASDGEVEDYTVTIAPAPILRADLSVTKMVNDSRPNVGDDVTFTVTLENEGPDAATGVMVTDLLPSGLTFLNSNQPGSYNSATGVWNVGSIANGVSIDLVITAFVATVGSKTNVAQVTASDQVDPAAGNNQASQTVTPQSANLSVSKSADDTSATNGQTVEFTIDVSNGGPDLATGVMVTDLLPAGLQFVDADPSTGSYNEFTGVWDVGQLGVGATETLQLLATLTTSQSVTNTARVESEQFDPVPVNDVSSVEVGACLTSEPLVPGTNRLFYSCVTPGGFAAFVVGSQLGSHYFDRWDVTVDIDDPSVPVIGIANINGVAEVLVDLTAAQLDQPFYVQAFEMIPNNQNISNVLSNVPGNAPFFNSLDANRDGDVSALDALVIINHLSRSGQAEGESLAGISLQSMRDYDTNGDGTVSAIDALMVVNHLSRANQPESESVNRLIPVLAPVSPPDFDLLDDDLLQMLADDSLQARLA